MADESFIDMQNAPMKAIKNIKLNFALSRRIRDEKGLVGASVTGTQQTGKSSYALQVLYELYQKDKDKALDHMFYSLTDLKERLLHALDHNYRMIAVCLDDASIHARASTYNTDRKAVVEISNMGDTLGILTKSLILTSPSGDLIKAFRAYNFYRVSIIQGRHEFDRVAKGYKTGMSPMMQKWVSTSFEDNFDIRLSFYEAYAKNRKRLSLNTLRSSESSDMTAPEIRGEFKRQEVKRILSEIRIKVSTGELLKDACADVGITPPTYYNYKKMLFGATP